jgi:hypothetical protein
MRKNSSPISPVLDANAPSYLLQFLPAHVERKIAARWQEWVPWVRIHVLRCGYDAARMADDTARMRRQHSQHLLRLLRVGISMRVVRRHGLDDPRITDEVRALLMRTAVERRRAAWIARHRGLSDPFTTPVTELDNSA